MKIVQSMYLTYVYFVYIPISSAFNQISSITSLCSSLRISSSKSMTSTSSVKSVGGKYVILASLLSLNNSEF